MILFLLLQFGISRGIFSFTKYFLMLKGHHFVNARVVVVNQREQKILFWYQRKNVCYKLYKFTMLLFYIKASATQNPGWTGLCLRMKT